MNSNQPIQARNSDPSVNGYVLSFLIQILKKRWFLFGNFVVISTLAVAVSYALPKTYTATIEFLPPNGGGGFGLSSLLGGIDIGASMMDGKSVIGSNQISAVFNSKQLQKRMIDKSNLLSRFGLDPKSEGKYHKAYKLFAEKIQITSEKDQGMGLSSVNSFAIEVEDGRPDSAYLIAKTVFFCLDSAMRKANVEDSRRKRIFAETQLAERFKLLQAQESELVAFQKKTKIYDIVAQGDATIRTTGELRSKLIEQSVQLAALEKAEGQQTSRYKALSEQKNALEQALSRLEKSGNPDILPSLNRTLDLGAKYLELKRNVEISIQVIKLLSQQLEMSKLEEARDDSPLKVISEPMIPDYKSRPKKAKVILTIVIFEHILLLMLMALRHVHRNAVKSSPEWIRIRAAFAKG